MVIIAATLYHGTKERVILDPAFAGGATDNPTSVWGVFFTPDPQEAERYVKDFHGGEGTVIKAEVELKNPYHMTFGEYERFVKLDLSGDLQAQHEANKQNAIAFKEELLSKGHDGIVIGQPGKMRPQEIVAFHRESITQL